MTPAQASNLKPGRPAPPRVVTRPCSVCGEAIYARQGVIAPHEVGGRTCAGSLRAWACEKTLPDGPIEDMATTED